MAQLGGDEFVVVCQDVHNPEEAPAVAARIVEAMRKLLELAGRQVTRQPASAWRSPPAMPTGSRRY